MIEFPVQYFESNLVFSQRGDVWAYYEIPGFNYDYLSEDEKEYMHGKLESLFWQMNADTHCLMVPRFQSIQQHHETSKQTFDGALKDVAIRHTDAVADMLQERLGREGTDYHFYLGVKLAKPEAIKKTVKQELKSIWQDFKRYLNETAGTDVYEIFMEEIQAYQQKEALVYTRIQDRVQGHRVNEQDIQWLIRRGFYRGIGEAPLRPHWTPVTQTVQVQGKKAIRPVHRDILTLTEGQVEKVHGRRLTVTQFVDGKEEEGHVAFLTLSHVPDDKAFPGEEWLYCLQSLPFPVEVSLRTETLEFRRVLRMVRNKQKELKDQDRHAVESDTDTSLQVLEGRQEAAELEANLSRDKFPILKTSVILCVSAATDVELNQRIQMVRDLYSDMLFEVEVPFGDQWLAFNECLVGGHRYITDYVHYMEPATVAGSMFGATRQLGDATGFFIGHTGVLNQPVYIDPSVAAQGQVGTKTNALSAAFLGALGTGKSMTSNLIAYLAVLAGGKALIIDPKSERGEWPRHLQDIQHQINVISLTTSKANTGKLDPFSIMPDRKDAAALAVTILSFLAGIDRKDRKYPLLMEAVSRVAESTRPSLSDVVESLLSSKEEMAKELGTQLNLFKDLSFAHILFGNGQNNNGIQLDTALNILQVQNLEMPTQETAVSDYTLVETLSVAMMYAISSFALKFIQEDRSTFKIVLMDEAWAQLSNSQGRLLATKLVRAGRAMNAGIYFVTQNAGDLLDEKMKNNIGTKYVFRSTDADEVENVLKFLNLQSTEYNRSTIQNLQNGQCLMQDIHGHSGVVNVDILFADLFNAFDTRPPEKKKRTEPKKLTSHGKLQRELMVR